MEGTISVLFLILTFLLFYSFFSPQTINFTTCGETIVDFNYFSILPLTPNIIEPMVGDLLGDGHLRFTHKDVNGKVRGNAHYAMTLKHYDYAYYLWKEIYSPIFTTTPLRPWPNPIVTGKTPTQYAFSSKSLPSITLLVLAQPMVYIE